MTKFKRASSILSLFAIGLLVILSIIGCSGDNLGSTTFGKLASKGKNEYSKHCSRCHQSKLIDDNAGIYLSFYGNANSLLDEIWSMPNGGEKSNWEILSYWLVEFGWVSSNETFDLDALSGITLTAN
jgi:hypothetical protein